MMNTQPICASGYVIPCMRPEFSQSLNADRPHTLITKDTKRAGTLEYRYDDTGEKTLVPNIWYNQTYQVRVASIRWDAEQCDKRADDFPENCPEWATEAQISQIVLRYRQRAARIRAEADRIEALGDNDYPVAASKLPLDYGDNVDNWVPKPPKGGSRVR